MLSREEAIFDAALALEAADQRSAYLDQACGGQAELRQRVEALLRRCAEAEGPLDRPAVRLATTTPEALAEALGTVIGPYKLLEQIGEGGFGMVYLAKQTEPVRRKVALKVLKPGMDTRHVVARFEAERQALALMDHPNIARVFDGGATPAGRPYFVMELVKGVPITDYCDQNQLTPRQRLELFLQVCQAVQHAHQKGIIHRDLKPSNVLVSRHDSSPVVKVIDFGVAKALGQALTDKTLFTGFAQLIGSPLYMSPEQARMSDLDIDTRSDIYSLGVVLYELLTGTTPFPRERFQKAGYDEIRRAICEEEPPRPSTRLAESRETLAAVSAQRQTEPARLSRLVRGELDWIAMKCLEKDRDRRYETANGLAMDVQRHLADEPVVACPPSRAYRLSKFARRHRGALLAAGLVVLALLAGITGTGLGLLRAQTERQAAEQNARAARQRDAETRAVLDFVESRVFAAARPEGQEGGLGPEVKLRQAVDAALPFVEQSFADQPLLEARLRLTLGIFYLWLGEAQTAADQFHKARALYREHLGPDHPDTLKSMHHLANSYHHLGQNSEALQLHEEVLALQKAKLGPDDPDTLKSMGCLANVYGTLNRFNDAVQLHEQTLALRRARLGPDHPDTLDSMNDLAECYRHLGRRPEGLKLHEETLALRKARLGPNHRDTLLSMANVAVGLSSLDRGAEAVPIIDDCLKRVAGQVVHPQQLRTMIALRMRHFQKVRDAAGCRATAEMWEALNRTDATSLYYAASARAVTAAVIRATDRTPEGVERAAAEADRAMAWLRHAVANGYKDADQMNRDVDLNALSGREDFQKLLAELKAARKRE
jgi:non-specific serine/threonine protein kinase/serine/threonine-protein kinase